MESYTTSKLWYWRLAIWGLAAFVHAIIVCACFFLYMHMADEVTLSEPGLLWDTLFQEVYKKEKDFMEHRAYLIIAVVLVVCSKIVSSLKRDLSVGLRIVANFLFYFIIFRAFQRESSCHGQAANWSQKWSLTGEGHLSRPKFTLLEKLKPCSRWMLATGAISVVLVTLLHVVPGLRVLVEKEEPNFEWDAFLPSILVVLVGFKQMFLDQNL